VELKVEVAPDTVSSAALVVCDWTPMPPPPVELKVQIAPETVKAADPGRGTVVAFALAETVEEAVGVISPNPPVELNIAVSLEIVKASELRSPEGAVAVAPGLSTPEPATALVYAVEKAVVKTEPPLVVTAGITIV